ncbi:MAG: DUF2804 domain-containing protein [Anaerolineales bacterium]|nr:DUF2804 domain-containing protein [Anaerolineales bacterium]
MQTEITQPGSLLAPSGALSQVGWARQPLLDCNLEQAAFYPLPLRPLQHFRIKRWDYYAIFTPQRFFSATIADLGYAGNIFVYTADFASGELHEQGLVVPLASGVRLPRNSDQGDSCYASKDVRLSFRARPGQRELSVDWPSFHDGRGIQAEIKLHCPPEHESMTIVIPIERRRFYYNRKINCLPAEGSLRYGQIQEQLAPDTCLGSLDWGRGVWAYSSFWNWASASGFLPGGRRIGLNLGCGFGDTSAASEDCLVLDGVIHKLDRVRFDYNASNYMQPWKFSDNQGRLNLEFTPFIERVARTDLKLIFSEVHQMFGRYNGSAITENGEELHIRDLIGFAEEHHARW